MVVAGPLATVKQSSITPAEEKFQEAVTTALLNGHSISKIAKHLAKGDKAAYHRYHSRITRLARKDAIFKARMQEALVGESLIGSALAVRAAIQRASRGRMDAVRFVMAHSGMYNEKVQHEHNGDIGITIKIARPEPVVDRTKRMDLEEGIVDADCVEE